MTDTPGRRKPSGRKAPTKTSKPKKLDKVATISEPEISEHSGGPLDNPRHEAFAQAVASGMQGAQAYRKVYGDHLKNPRSQASDLLKDNPDISERVKEIQDTGAKGAVMTLQQEMEYLTKAILTPIDQIDETSILCQRVKNSDSGRELWMVDKLRAMEMLIRLKGEFAADKVQHGGEMTVNIVQTEERRKELIARRREAMEAPKK
jgi:hypothetical protein